MKLGLLGTGAIANKHAEAYRNLGWTLIACSNKSAGKGEAFAQRWNCRFVPDYQELCRLPGLDYIDVCAFPDFHLAPVRACAEVGRAVMLQKPIATNLPEAREIVSVAREARIKLGVMSQHRFDDSTAFLKRALQAGRLGRLLEADAYVKWFRDDEYYRRPIKGSWSTEGGGALINQAIHQVDLLRYLAGPVVSVCGMWQLGAAHAIESEDIVNALLQFASGATGVIQAATAVWPGYTERVELHGNKGTAVISGERLSVWDVRDDEPANLIDPAPLAVNAFSGSSDPMAIQVASFERQFLDFAGALESGREPLVNGEEGLHALEVVLGVYESCRAERPVRIDS